MSKGETLFEASDERNVSEKTAPEHQRYSNTDELLESLLDHDIQECVNNDEIIHTIARFQFEQYPQENSVMIFKHFKRLLKYHITVDGELISRMLRDVDFSVQILACQFARFLHVEELTAFLTSFHKDFEEILKSGRESFTNYNREQKNPMGRMLAEQSPHLFWYVRKIFESLGCSFPQGLQSHEKERLEHEQLGLMSKFICEQFLSEDQRKSIRDPDTLIVEMESGRLQNRSATEYVSRPRRRRRDDRLVEGRAQRKDESLAVTKEAFLSLQKIGGEATIDLLIAWLQFYPGSHDTTIADVLSTVDPEMATTKTLPLLKHKDSDVVRAASRVLYRLEFGHVRISEEGVKYLGKMYDLGDKNNADYFARRLTANGEIGIFNENKKLINYFQLEGLDSDEARIRARVLEFTYGTLFTPHKNETPEERAQREQYIKEFQEDYFGFFKGPFEETGVNFKNLSFKEQGQLLLFYKSATPKEKERVVDFLKQYQEDGFRAFLSLEHGREMGDTILTIGEKLPAEAAKLVFEKYSEIARATEDVRTYVQEQFGEELAKDPAALDHIVENLLKRGKDLLVQFANEAERQKEKESGAQTRAALARLAGIKADILLFASVFREAGRKGVVRLDELRDTVIQTQRASNLSEYDREEMRRIFRENREGTYPTRLLTDSLQDFDTAVQSDHAIFHILRYKEDTVGFLRFEQRPNGHVYLGSLNTRPETQRSSFSIALMQSAIAQYDHSVIDAVIWEKNSASKELFEKLGFLVAGKIEDYHGTGETFIMMRRSAKEIVEVAPKKSDEFAVVV